MKPAHCHVAERGCLNPAGYGLASGGAVLGAGGNTTWTCPVCGEATCKVCRQRSRHRVVCKHCAREEARQGRAVPTRSIQASRLLVAKSRDRLEAVVNLLASAVSPCADRLLGITKREYVDRVLGEVETEIQGAIDTLYNAQQKIEQPK
jgi:hypothetical protein